MSSHIELSMHLLLATKHNGAVSGILKQILYLLASAIFGAAALYVATRLSTRQDRPLKRLSWEADTDSALVAVGPQIRDNVSVSYNGVIVSGLVAIRCRVLNTGNQLVKDEHLRFSFPEGTTVIEAGFAPSPEPELKCSEEPADPGKLTERSFTLGHLEVGQEVSFELVAAGPQAGNWKVHPFNETGGVVFQQREVSRIRDEQEHLRPFVVITTSLIIFSILIRGVEATGVFDFGFVAVAGLLGQVLLVVFLTPHIMPMARLLRRLIDRWLVPPEPTTNVTIQGGEPRVIAASGFHASRLSMDTELRER